MKWSEEQVNVGEIYATMTTMPWGWARDSTQRVIQHSLGKRRRRCSWWRHKVYNWRQRDMEGQWRKEMVFIFKTPSAEVAPLGLHQLHLAFELLVSTVPWVFRFLFPSIHSTRPFIGRLIISWQLPVKPTEYSIFRSRGSIPGKVQRQWFNGWLYGYQLIIPWRWRHRLFFRRLPLIRMFYFGVAGSAV